jgi:hypothetical protein
MSKIEQDIKTIDFEQKFVSEGLEYYKYLDEHTQNEYNATKDKVMNDINYINMDRSDIEFWNEQGYPDMAADIGEQEQQRIKDLRDNISKLKRYNYYLLNISKGRTQTVNDWQIESALDKDIDEEGNILRTDNDHLIEEKEKIRLLEEEYSDILNRVDANTLTVQQQQSEFYVWLIIGISIALFALKTGLYPSDKGNLLTYLLLAVIIITIILVTIKYK